MKQTPLLLNAGLRTFGKQKLFPVEPVMRANIPVGRAVPCPPRMSPHSILRGARWSPEYPPLSIGSNWGIKSI